MSNSQENSCVYWRKSGSINCPPENLLLIEKLEELNERHEGYEIEFYLKYCQVCGIVCKEKVSTLKDGSQYSHFYRIPENFVQNCHCIGFLKPIEIILDKKICEDNEMYFAWEKETKMKCERCGEYYLESIYQNNYDGVFYQTYSKVKGN